jgi:hypothetical protein
MEQNKVKTTEEILWEIARAVERLEHAILPTSYNGNKGLVTQVLDHETRLNDLEEDKIKRDENEAQREVYRKKRNDFLTVAAAVIGTSLAALTIYLSLKK